VKGIVWLRALHLDDERRSPMKTITGVLLIAAALAFGSGCARPDWIERTLVTVDVTGTWEGSAVRGGQGSFLRFNLEQQGPQVKGFMRNVASSICGEVGPIEGTIAGDMFTFKQTNGPATGQMTVSGDEMNGMGSSGCGRFQVSLRRVNTSSSPPSPKP
jgi:hypothetical protein